MPLFYELMSSIGKKPNPENQQLISELIETFPVAHQGHIKGEIHFFGRCCNSKLNVEMVNDSFLTGKVHLWPLGFDCIHFSRNDFPPQFLIIHILDNIQSLSIIKFVEIIYNLINFSWGLAIFPIN